MLSNKVLSINNANEALYYLKKELERRTNIMWKTKNGEEINIREMSDTHLENTIGLLERQVELNEISADYYVY